MLFVSRRCLLKALLNPEKFAFGADTVEFAGSEITYTNGRPCKKYLDTICDFPTPTNITNVLSWFGLLNQESYAFAATEHMLPFCQSLKLGTPFKWDSELNELFKESKSVTNEEIEEGVRIFEKYKPTCIATDWSKTLPLPLYCTLLLSHRLESYTCWEPLHTCS